MKRSYTQSLLIALALNALFCFGALSQSVRPAPTDRYDCESIILATFLRCDDSKSRTKKSIRAYFRPDRILKGPLYGGPFAVTCENFCTTDDGTGKPREPLNKHLIPVRGSRWILFIPWCAPQQGSYETFPGASGRVIYTEQHLDEVVSNLNRRGQLYKSDL
jgi:hypothetical protein